tara:strand:- start:1510 stop:2898 length:1389 start_codon:yes stop_codon:yes gene_type:complete
MGSDKKNKSDKKRITKTREENIHLVRVSKLYRYLIDNNARIEVEIEDQGVKRKVLYTNKQRDGNDSITDLFSDGMGISNNKVRDYTRRRISITDKHSFLDNVPKIGRLITAITPYLDIDDDIDNTKNVLFEEGFFGLKDIKRIPIMDMVGAISDFEKVDPNTGKLNLKPYQDLMGITLIDGKPFIEKYRNNILSLVETGVELMGEDESILLELEQLPISGILKKLVNESNDAFSYLAIERKKLYPMLIEFMSFYSEAFKKITSDQIIPFYSNFDLPTRSHTFSESSKGHDLLKILTQERITKKDRRMLFEHRFGVVWELSKEGISFLDLKNYFKALVLFVEQERLSIEIFLQQSSIYITKRMKFVIYSSNSIRDSVNRQQHNVDLDTLTNILIDYQFKRGVSKAFEFYEGNILTEDLEKFPEPTIAIDRINKVELRTKIFKESRNYIINRLKKDLNYNYETL